ncbi:OmpA family protein [Thiomicrorhabdus sp. Kp2]|uniref:OmpA/MotB family protein n=1 Tax=Thiomicrorhabdus sp. Kp2 TaxID=1123518 RepID=UPI000411D81E|nr:OmpA family protein [Thiomicrorhabdus sp. Kp2]
MSLLLISLFNKSKSSKTKLPGLVGFDNPETQQIKRNRLWLLTYISLFTSLLAFFILIISLVELEGSTPKRNYQKLVKKLNQEVVFQLNKQGVSWLNIEHSLTKGVRLSLPSDLIANSSLFESARAKINPRYLPYLQSISDLLLSLDLGHFTERHAKLIRGIETNGAKVHFLIRIEGHTDSFSLAPTARFRNNVELSTYRAYAMMEWLRIHTGLPKSSFAISGYGSFHPITQDPTEPQNRRIEIYLLPLIKDAAELNGESTSREIGDAQ